MIIIPVCIFVFLFVLPTDASESIVTLNTNNHYTMVKDYTLDSDILNPDLPLDSLSPSPSPSPSLSLSPSLSPSPIVLVLVCNLFLTVCQL